jgi:hypothetical protein
MEGHTFYRWSPRFLDPPVKDGILMNLSVRQWSCTFHHTKKYGFHHKVSFDSILGRFSVPGPFSFSVGSSYVQCRIDNRGQSSAIWSCPDQAWTATTSTDGVSFSLKITEWQDCFYRASVRFGADPEFACLVGNSSFRSLVQLTNEFTSTAMQLTFGGFTTAVGFVVDGMTFVTPPVHGLIHYAGKNCTANLTMSYFDKWYQRSAFAWQRGHFRVGFRNRADRFVPKSLKDLSCGIQFNLTESVTLAVGYCRGRAPCQVRKSLFGRCHLLAGSYFVGEKGKITRKFFLVFDYSGKQDKRQTADSDGPAKRD